MDDPILVTPPPKLATLSNKMADGLMEITKGNLKSSITSCNDTQFATISKLQSGIQVLRYISMDYQTQCDMNKSMHVSDIMQLQWTGDELQQVQHMIEVITQYVAECGETWTEPVRREFLYRLMCMSKCSFIETHVAAFTRARPLNGKAAGKKYTFEYLFEGMQQYVQPLKLDRNEGRRV